MTCLNSVTRAMPAMRFFIKTALAFCLFLILQTRLFANETFAPTGKLFNIGSHTMHLFCAGEGGPTVILDAGLGGLSLEWIRVQAELAKHTKVCAYDRAGYGWSERSPLPRTSAVIVSELSRLLKAANVPAPYVLVGHSFGGYTAELFASRFHQQTAGMVLIDASHPGQVERFRSIGLNTVPVRRVTHVRYNEPRLPENLPEEVRDVTYQLLVEGNTMTTIADEYIDFYTSAQQVAADLAIPDVPVMVLTRGIPGWKNSPNGERYERLWQELQSELAHLSPTSAHLWANLSGHHIHLDQPALTTNAIMMVVDRARQDLRREITPVHLARHEQDLDWQAFASATWKLNQIRKRMFRWPITESDVYAMLK